PKRSTARWGLRRSRRPRTPRAALPRFGRSEPRRRAKSGVARRGVGRFDRRLADVLAGAAAVVEVAEAEPALRFGEVAQRFFVGLIPLLRERLEEVDHFRGRVVVGRRLHDLLASRGVVDLLKVRSGAAGGI